MDRGRIESRRFIQSEERNFGHCYGQVSAVFSHLPFSYWEFYPAVPLPFGPHPCAGGMYVGGGRERSTRPQTMENTAPLWGVQTCIQGPDGTWARIPQG